MTNCSHPWIAFQGDIPDSLLSFFVFYCCAICIIGVIGNVLALWCVVTCSRTCNAIKILLCALFSTTLLMCVVVIPCIVHTSLAKLWCDREVSMTALYIVIMSYIVLTMMELFFIFIMALLRTLAVWSPVRRQIKVRTAVTVVVGSTIYNSSITALVAAEFWLTAVSKATLYTIVDVYNAVHFVLPVFLTLACYLSTILAIRRNKCRMSAVRKTTAKTQMMDQATRAMLAVFVSNLVLSLPHSIYHMVSNDYQIFSYVIMHTIFFTHLFADPLAFLCCNIHHRRRVMKALKSLVGLSPCTKMTSPPTSQDTQLSSTQKSVEEGQGKASSGGKSMQEPSSPQDEHLSI